ncbi:serum response factor homolog [Copidosoma floridanum]|uniref:serum response factor homolog n=1 Tax=Copidosoma floridanum TaxID=29053 RepID=UPI0006C99DA2|nr:serum response factor homolog [Copidosoma floridanum]
MDQSISARDTRYASLGFGIGIIGDDSITEIYGRSNSQLQSQSDSENSVIVGVTSDSTGSIASETVNISQPNDTSIAIVNMHRGLKRTSTDVCYDNLNESPEISSQTQSLSNCVSNHAEESYTNLVLSKKSPPSNGKKTKGRVKIKMEYIDNKLRRYTTFSKRKTGIMKKV